MKNLGFVILISALLVPSGTGTILKVRKVFNDKNWHSDVYRKAMEDLWSGICN